MGSKRSRVPLRRHTAYVLIGAPTDEDINNGQSDVVLIHENSIRTTPSGWSGEMETHAPVVSRGSFVASSDVAMLVLKFGNVLGATTGVVFDDLTVGGDSQPLPPPLKQEPSAAVSTSPASGNPPLTTRFVCSLSADRMVCVTDYRNIRRGSAISTPHARRKQSMRTFNGAG